MKRILLVLIMISVLIVSGCVGQSSEKTTSNAQEILELSKPAVVSIVTSVSGTVKIPEATIDFEEKLAPKNTSYTRQVFMTVAGSGFVVSSNGYIITNAHLVSLDPDFLEQELLRSAAEDELEDFRKGVGRNETKSERDDIMNYVMKYGKVQSSETNAKVLLNSSSGEFTESGVQVIIAGEFPGKDIAIIKIEGKNYPTVDLGDSDELSAGDKVYLLGYTGDSVTGLALTAGTITGSKQILRDLEVFETDAAITEKSSGGPVLIESGEVVGISSSGSVDFNTGNEVDSFNYIIPVNIAREFMQKINVTNKRGPVDYA